MRLKVIMEHEVIAASDKLCSWDCEYSEGEWPPARCNLFGGDREKSESEDVDAWMRLPDCIERAKPAREE